MDKPGVALGPTHGQLDMSRAASIDATAQRAQIERVLSYTAAQEKIPGNRHSDGSPPALDRDGPRRDSGDSSWGSGGGGGGSFGARCGGQPRKASCSGGSGLGG